MPVFEPNEFLYENFSHMGDEPWEIYAWAAREAIATHGNLNRVDLPVREKLAYENFMCNLQDSVTVNGQTYTECKN
jgi:hypothetical protein